MGSKQAIAADILASVAGLKFDSVLDLFSGSGVVSYLFKAQGKAVTSNDYMAFAATFARAFVENNSRLLDADDIERACSKPIKSDNFVSRTFGGLYFSFADNRFIDTVRSNLRRFRNPVKRSLIVAALVRACMKRRPRGIFTYIGDRYDDGRRDVRISLHDQFIEAVDVLNRSVFDNGRTNEALHGDALSLRRKADLVYVDPPYFSPLSDNEYVRRYHFVEGLARNWEGVELQLHTKTKKFRGYPTPFSTHKGTIGALEKIFSAHRNSILLVSYSSNALPTRDEILKMMARVKRTVDSIPVHHHYSFGNQGHKIGNVNNKVREYLFIGT
jgi:DNA adenine methylase